VQELSGASLDLPGFLPGAGEAQQPVVGLCRLRDYAEREVNLLVRMPVPAAGEA